MAGNQDRRRAGMAAVAGRAKPMHKRTIKTGDFVYREGDASDAVHFILTGEVGVLRQSGQECIELGVLKDGQIFGEMGVIQDTVRSTTTQALTDVVLVSVPKDDFLKAFGPANSIALPLLRMLCERLRNVDSQLMNQLHHETAKAVEVARIVLLPDSKEMETQIGEEGLVIRNLPYVVGRRTHKDDAPSTNPTSLRLRPYEAYQIEPEHFAIEEHDGHIHVRDLGSHLGTCVNGTRIAKFEHAVMVQLGVGPNTVQAGGTRSPYKFRVIIQKT